MTCRRRNPEAGYAMILVFLLAALIAIALYREMPRVAFEAQRAKEQLLIERGEQYKRAIQLFVRKVGRYPATIEELENTNNIRFLRKRYVDPMTGKDKWRLIHVNGGVLTDSIIPKNTPGQPGQAPGQNQQQQASVNTFIGEGPVMGAANDPSQQQNNPALRRRASDDRPVVTQEVAQPAQPEAEAENSDNDSDNSNDNTNTNDNADETPAPVQQPVTPQGANVNQPGAVPGQPTYSMQQGRLPFQPGIPPGQYNPAMGNQQQFGAQNQYNQGVNAGFQQPNNSGQTNDQSSGSSVYAQPGLGQQATPTGGMQGTFPGQQPGGFPAQQGGLGQQPGGFGQQPGGFPNQQGGFGQQPGGFPNQQGGFGQQQGGFPNQQGGFGQQQGGFGQQPGGFGNQPQPVAPGSGGISMGALGLTGSRPGGLQGLQSGGPGMGGSQVGGGIAGVASESKGPSIIVYNERKKYNEWEFVYDQSKDRGLAGVQRGGAPGTPAQQMGNMPPGIGQQTGQAGAFGPNGGSFGGNTGSGFGSSPGGFGSSPGGFGSSSGGSFGSSGGGFGQPSPQPQPQPPVQQPPPN